MDIDASNDNPGNDKDDQKNVNENNVDDFSSGKEWMRKMKNKKYKEMTVINNNGNTNDIDVDEDEEDLENQTCDLDSDDCENFERRYDTDWILKIEDSKFYIWEIVEIVL